MVHARADADCGIGEFKSVGRPRWMQALKLEVEEQAEIDAIGVGGSAKAPVSRARFRKRDLH